MLAAPARAQLEPSGQPAFVPHETAFLTPTRWYATPASREASASLSLPGAWASVARQVDRDPRLEVVPDVGLRLAEASRAERHADLLFIAERSAALGIEYFRAFNLASAVTELESALQTYGRTLASWTRPDAVAEVWQFLALAELSLAELEPEQRAEHEARAERALREMIRLAPGRIMDADRYPASVVAAYEQSYVAHVLDEGAGLRIRASEAALVSELLGVDQLVSAFAISRDAGVLIVVQVWDAREQRFAHDEALPVREDVGFGDPLAAALSRAIACLPLLPAPEPPPESERGAVYATFGYTGSSYLTTVTTSRFLNHGAHFGVQWLGSETFGAFVRFSQSAARNDPEGDLVARVDSTRLAAGALTSARLGRLRGFVEGGVDLTRIGPVRATTSFWCKVSEGDAELFDEERSCDPEDVIDLDARLHAGLEFGVGAGVQLGGPLWFDARARMSLYVAPFDSRSLDTPFGVDLGLTYRF